MTARRAHDAPNGQDGRAMSIGPGRVTDIERILDDAIITVDRQPGSRSGQQSFPGAEVSELGLVWLTRLLGRIDPGERHRLEQHLFVPVAVIAHPHSRPIGWLLADVPDGPCRTVAAIRTGQGDRLRDALVMAKQLADLVDVMERHGIVNASPAPGRVVVMPGPQPWVRVLLGPSTRVDSVPLLLDPPTPAMSDRLCLAHLIDLLLPPGVRDHPTLRDLKTLAGCWRDHDLSLAPALWSTALGDAIRSLGADTTTDLVVPVVDASQLLPVPETPRIDLRPAPEPAPIDIAPIPEPAPIDHTPAPALQVPEVEVLEDEVLEDEVPEHESPEHVDDVPEDESPDLDVEFWIEPSPPVDAAPPDTLPEPVLSNLDGDPVIELLVRQERSIGAGDDADSELRSGLVGLDLSDLTSTRRVELLLIVLVALGVIALAVFTLSRI